jgi:hypothetical protein
MKFYICSGTSLARFCDELASDLRMAGHEVVSRWHSGELGKPRLELDDSAELRDRAIQDLSDIHRCDILIAISKPGGRGGRHYETGFAEGREKEVWLIGDPEHAFHLLADRKFDDTIQLLAFLKEFYPNG